MLLVVGSLAYDSVETAHGKVEHALGGSATFFSIASSMFLPTSVVGVVGQDFRRGDLERLQVRGIDTSGVEVAEGHTFRWGGVYSKHFETRTTLFTELNVFAEFKPKLGPQHRDAEFLFLRFSSTCWTSAEPTAAGRALWAWTP
jgi:sugar/nucleoside kinase (ribokinase family)